MALTQLASTADALSWLQARGAQGLATDSRRVVAGDAFIAWPGYATDARAHVAGALTAGASACLVEAEGADAFEFDDSKVAAVQGLKAATGDIASAFFGNPSQHLDVVAITGTNGKTSCAWWTAQALTALGQRCGVVGTLGVGQPPMKDEPSRIEFNGLTTPDPITLQRAFKRFADEGFVACALEASSHGIEEHRLSGTRIKVALFTNLTQDHLDYHGSMDAYGAAKAKLFAWPGLQAAVLNIDDAFGARLSRDLQASAVSLTTYSTRGAASLRAANVVYRDGGLCFDVIEGSARAAVSTALIGDYNVSNVLAVIGGLRALGVALVDAASVCAQLTPVPGRMQRVSGNAAAPEVVVDYAHTPDALEKSLLALQALASARGGKLWCVFGCGGNRDVTKRPMMGALAQRLAQHVVITTDNPRFEAPAFINLQIVAGLNGNQLGVKVIENRRSAIQTAVREAAATDVILVAGKGHEDYQDIKGVKHPFSDVDEAVAALALREAVA
jgi:UDP-N-acetylmuramyl-tripeptide synthetase